MDAHEHKATDQAQYHLAAASQLFSPFHPLSRSSSLWEQLVFLNKHTPMSHLNPETGDNLLWFSVTEKVVGV